MVTWRVRVQESKEFDDFVDGDIDDNGDMNDEGR